MLPRLPGRAVDIGSPDCPNLTESFSNTKEFAWLQSKAGRFRFALSYPPGNPFRIAYEPWHWCLTNP
jgi:D-alanyl-D-alanine carboxypeptidase